MFNAGDVNASSIVEIPFNTSAVAGESITIGTNGTIAIYKDGSTTERSSANGITFSEDHDGHIGPHLIRIDLSDNTDASFYAAGSIYKVMYHTATIDGKAVSAWVGLFSIDKTNQKADVAKWLASNAPALVGGLLNSNVGSFTAGVFTNGVFGAGAIDAAAIAANAIGASELATDAVTEIVDAILAASLATNVSTLLTRMGTPSDLGGGATLSANLSDIEAQTDDIGVAGLGLSAIPKTGFILAATGLDAITATDPGGVASTFPQMLVQLWRRFFKRSTKDSGAIITYADNGTTVRTTQLYTSSGADEDVEAGT